MAVGSGRQEFCPARVARRARPALAAIYRELTACKSVLMAL
jgi:hypothetical protein